MVEEVVRALMSILSEQRKQVAEWVDVLQAAQWASNTWLGFDAEERTWGSLRKIHSSPPDFVLKELRKLRLTRPLKGKLASEYGISL